jgi:hypothetical protein
MEFMMRRFYFLAFLATLVLVACPSQKKNGKETVIDTPKDTTTKVVNLEKETASELDELVYEGIGASVLKIESNARSQAELKGRKEVIRVMAEDAKQLIKLFIQEQPGFFSDGVNADEYGKAIEETMNASSTLKGCKVSEYNQSENKDTTFASMEMELMNGYDVIESAVISAGMKNKYLNEAKTDSFKKTFKEFFTIQKKKLLTKPA